MYTGMCSLAIGQVSMEIMEIRPAIAAYQVWFLAIYRCLCLRWQNNKDCPFLLSLCPPVPHHPHPSRAGKKYVHVREDFLLEENQKKTFGDFMKDWVMAVVLLTKSEGGSIQLSASVP